MTGYLSIMWGIFYSYMWWTFFSYILFKRFYFGDKISLHLVADFLQLHHLQKVLFWWQDISQSCGGFSTATCGGPSSATSTSKGSILVIRSLSFILFMYSVGDGLFNDNIIVTSVVLNVIHQEIWLHRGWGWVQVILLILYIIVNCIVKGDWVIFMCLLLYDVYLFGSGMDNFIECENEFEVLEIPRNILKLSWKLFMYI